MRPYRFVAPYQCNENAVQNIVDVAPAGTLVTLIATRPKLLQTNS